MKFSLLFLIAFTGLFNHVAFADDSQSVDEKKIKNTFSQDMNEISGFRFLQCSPYQAKIFGGADGHFVLDFIKKRVVSYDIEDLGEGVIARNNYPDKTLSFNPILFAGSISQIYRLATYVHEARHSDGDGWFHVSCPDSIEINGRSYSNGRMAGADDCDDTDIGAYGVEYTFLRSIKNSCSNCNEKTKLDAELFSDDEALDRITDPVAVRRLVANSNSMAASAWKEFGVVFDNVHRAVLKKHILMSDWNEQCQSDNSCLKSDQK